jgi:hypothetical protein
MDPGTDQDPYPAKYLVSNPDSVNTEPNQVLFIFICNILPQIHPVHKAVVNMVAIEISFGKNSAEKQGYRYSSEKVLPPRISECHGRAHSERNGLPRKDEVLRNNQNN